MQRVTREEVALALTPHAVLRHFGVQMRQAGDELRGKLCPTCGQRSRESVAVNANTGRWSDHAHGCHGDIFDLVGGLAGIDARAEFPKVLELAAEIAGVTPSSDPQRAEHARREHAERQARARQAEAEARVREAAEARGKSATVWGALERSRRNERGEGYLRARGLDVATLIGDDRVRFYASGDIACPLWALDDSALINVVCRRIDGGEPKIGSLAGCPTAGTFGGKVTDLVGPPVVLTEGLFDTLTALLAWPRAVVLGAHGASSIPKVAQAAAPLLRSTGARVALVPHRDEAGESATQAAIARLRAAGVRDANIVVLRLAEKDLNEAWSRGWRPRASQRDSAAVTTEGR
ncbi:MAG: toprim domain-containing protein [Deltaproteobacteria bacterium]|nr:toprim domain-containing protein [Deltaproteobacteria bacterium]